MICPECTCNSRNPNVCDYCEYVIEIPQKKIKIKEENVKDLVKELDRVFSIFKRTEHIDANGIVKCFTCGKYAHWREGKGGDQMHCGHYISRDYKALRWDELNTRVQCAHCNVTLKGNYTAFAQALIRMHGPGILDLLDTKKNNEFKLERGKLKILINYYSKKIEHIK